MPEASHGEEQLILSEAIDFARYLYEEERDRTAEVNRTTTTYLVFIGATAAGAMGALNWAAVGPEQLLAPSSDVYSWAFSGVLLFAFVALVASLVLTILVVRVWRFESLIDPEYFLFTARLSASVEDLKAIQLGCFVAATKRRRWVNNRKASHLAQASRFYRIGLGFLVLASVMFVLR